MADPHTIGTPSMLIAILNTPGNSLHGNNPASRLPPQSIRLLRPPWVPRVIVIHVTPPVPRMVHPRLRGSSSRIAVSTTGPPPCLCLLARPDANCGTQRAIGDRIPETHAFTLASTTAVSSPPPSFLPPQPSSRPVVPGPPIVHLTVCSSLLHFHVQEPANTGSCAFARKRSG